METSELIYRYMDPLTGQIAEMSSQQLNACYTSMGYQAVALLPDTVESCIRGAKACTAIGPGAATPFHALLRFSAPYRSRKARTEYKVIPRHR